MKNSTQNGYIDQYIRFIVQNGYIFQYIRFTLCIMWISCCKNKSFWQRFTFTARMSIAIVKLKEVCTHFNSIISFALTDRWTLTVGPSKNISLPIGCLGSCFLEWQLSLRPTKHWLRTFLLILPSAWHWVQAQVRTINKLFKFL